MKCKQCGTEMPDYPNRPDTCLNCSRENLRKTLNENPDLKKAFKETVEEMKWPENIRKMADDTVRFMETLQKLRK